MTNDLISRSALLEGFQFRLPINSERTEVIARCVETARRLINEAPAVDAPKWISVEDRLPEREGRYLCVKRIGKSGAVYVQLMNGDSYGFSMDHFYTDDVTHWMPLPEPPKEV